MDVPLDFSQILPDRACSILHRALRDPHEALRFLTILFDCCLPELGIYLLRFRQRLAGLKCPEQMVVFAQPRSDKFAPFFFDILQGGVEPCIQLPGFREHAAVHFVKSREVEERYNVRGYLGGSVTR
jgi:hypothetical protein